jgi:hypothetical protein
MSSDELLHYATAALADVGIEPKPVGPPRRKRKGALAITELAE